jgi:hypothetical protein
MNKYLSLIFPTLALLFAPAGVALGNNWIQAIAPSAYWTTIASSADGTRLVAGGDDDNLWTSTNSGVTWTVAGNSPVENWRVVASSADGTKLVAVTLGYGMWISDDSGLTWTASGPFTNPVSVE